MDPQVPLFLETELPVPADANEKQVAQDVASAVGYGEDADIDPDTGTMFN